MAFSHGLASFISFGFMLALFKGWLPFSDNLSVMGYVLLFVAGFMVFGYSWAESRFNLLLSCTGSRKSFFPVYVSRLGTLDVFSIILLMLLKYVLKPIGLVSWLWAAKDGVHFALPELKMDASLAVDEGDEGRYDAATKMLQVSDKTGPRSASSDRLLLLPALTTPIMSTLLANRNCPVLPFGSVNTKNRFEFLDPEACRDPAKFLDLKKATVTGRLGGDKLPGRRVKRGMEFDIEVEVNAPRKGSKQSKVVFKQVFTTLAFLSSSTKPLFKASESKDDVEDVKWSSASSEVFHLDKKAPFRWAAVCADYNPIHVSGIMAKWFGFTSTIAHGNHVLAVALQQMHDSASASKSSGPEGGMQNLLYSNQPSALEVQFKRPMPLPISLSIEFGSSKGKYAMRAVKDGKEHMTAQAMELHL